MRMVMKKSSFLPAAERIAGGLASVAPMKDGAWREDAAGDTHSNTTEATLLPQRLPAAHILLPAASSTRMVKVLKTSVRGEARDY